MFHRISRIIVVGIAVAALAAITESRAQGVSDQLEAAADSMAASDTVAKAKPKVQARTLYYVRGDSIVAEVRMTPVEQNVSFGAGDVAATMLWGGGGKTWLALKGETSELHIPETKPTFVVVMARDQVLRLRLAAFQLKKKGRWAQTDDEKGLEFLKKPVAIDLKEAKPNVWAITPKQALKPGEYGFANNSNGPVCDFTIASEGAKK
jgi:hypothetical protein